MLQNFMVCQIFWDNMLDSFCWFYIKISYSNYFLQHPHTKSSGTPNNFSKMPPCHHVTTSVSHLTCHYHCHCCCQNISQSFDLPSTTTSLHHHASHSSDSPTTMTSVSHLTCPLPFHQHIIALPCYCISQPFDLPTATTSVI